MKFVIQVVENASVRVVEEADGTVPEGGGYISGSIGRGFMVLVGISGSDTEAIADKMVEKMRTGLPVHPLCGLQKGKPPFLCPRRTA